jgi:hypothetical protein
VEQFAVLARADFINHIRLQVDVKRTRNVFPRCRFRKEGAETVSTITSYNIITLKTAIWLKTANGASAP